MTPKEKAKELVNKFARSVEGNKTFNQRVSESIVLSIIAVDEIIEAIKITTGHCELRELDQIEVLKDLEFWQEVKQEIEKL